jgi:hypothetical protein
MSFISVILCTHNPKPTYLSRTLEALRQQSLPLSDWEFLLIDNRSEVPLADSLDLSWQGSAQVIREEKLGLTPARLRGIQESRGDLLVFVDDDNVLDLNFLEEVQRIAKERPFLGSWSGQCRAEFEETPPEWTRRYWGNLVIREFEEDRWSNLPRLANTMPCGAGLCVRREVAKHYFNLHATGRRGFQFDRTGDSLVSGGDNDLAASACDLGLGVGIICSLKIVHLISPERLSARYLERLAEGIHFSSALLDHLRGLPVPPRTKSRRLLDALRLARLRDPHRAIQGAAIRGYDRAVTSIQYQK